MSSPIKNVATLSALCVLFSLAAPLAAVAQQQIPNPPPPAIPGMAPSSPPDPGMQRMATRMAVQRNIDRQKDIVNDTAQLLQLAQELNTDVSKSNKDTLSLSVVKKADEIEKLAKSIKQKMRDGQ
jgi:hypothetical protein